MLFVSLFRAIKFSLQDVIRNIWLSLVIVIILILALFSVNLLLTVKIIGETAINAIKEKVDVNLFIKNESEEKAILALKAQIENLPPVKEVTYISEEEALANFKAKHQGNPEIIEALKELNKNPLSATLIIKPKSLDSLDDLINRLNVIDNNIIESKNFSDYKTMLEKINGITAKVSEVGLIISSIFVFITVLVVYNSVRVAIYTHRREITIMRLVGASNWFIKLPFIFSSLIYTALGLTAIMAIYFTFLTLLQPYLETFFVGYSVNLIAYFKDNFLYIFGAQFLGGCLINTIASLSALQVYSRI